MPVAHYYGGGIFYPGEAAATVLHTFRSWALTLPEQATTSVALLRLPDLPEVPEPLRGTPVGAPALCLHRRRSNRVRR